MEQHPTSLTFSFTPARAPRRTLPSARSQHTEAAYRRDRERYLRWCEGEGCPPLGAESVAAYLIHLATSPPLPPDNKPRPAETLPATHAYSTVRRRLAAIADWFLSHDDVGDPRLARPVVEALRKIRADMDRVRAEQLPPEATARELVPVEAADVDVVRAIVERILEETPATAGAQLRALRDRALLLLCYAAALTREEVRTLQREGIVLSDDGVALTVNRSEFRSRERTVVLGRSDNPETDPIETLLELVARAGMAHDNDFIFCAIGDSGNVDASRPLSPAQISRIFNERVSAAGFDPRKVTPHVLRVSVAVQMQRAGGSIAEILAHTGHRDSKSLLQILKRGAHWPQRTAELRGL
jgi:site-specific recombinase XerD